VDLDAVANQAIRLTPESFSDIGGHVGNLAIYTGTIIENAVGGGGNIPLTKDAVAIFKSIPKTHPDKIFPVSLCWLRRYFEKTRASAKQSWSGDGANPFKDMRLHDFRHEALSRLSDAGLNVIELAHISGHRVLSMLQCYVHPEHEAIFTKLDRIQPSRGYD
jgi:integrase